MKPRTCKPGQRQDALERQRKLKMARSVHAYVRGSTKKFYEWLEAGSSTGIPEGPPVWICGDCHVGNLGPVADQDGRVDIQIRDLDQTVIGNPAHDLVRLGLSLATAVRGSDLPGVTTARMLEQMVLGYGAGLSGHRRTGKGATGDAGPVTFVLKQALKREWRHLAEERIEDTSPSIPRGERFWSISKEEKEEVKRIFDSQEARDLITCLRGRESGDAVHVLDAAYWMKGCSSLGRLRYAVLLKTGKGKPNQKHLCLIDIKEAVRAAAPRNSEEQMPRDHAQRVVTGARALSPFLGDRMLAERFLDRPVVIREILPQDLKIEMDRITADEAIASARFLAGVVGKAHARQMDVATRRKWQGELKRNRLKNLDAPSWLWTSVVELIATHETAYLEYCREYARGL